MDIIDFTESTDWDLFAEQKELLLNQQKDWNDWLNDVNRRKDIFGNGGKRFKENERWLTEKLEKLDGLIHFLDSLQDLLVDEYGFKLSLIYPKTDEELINQIEVNL